VLVLMVLLAAVQAVSPEPATKDLCNNLPGLQEQIPEGYTSIEGICVLASEMVTVDGTVAPSPIPPTPSCSKKKSGPKLTLLASLLNSFVDQRTGAQLSSYMFTARLQNADENTWCRKLEWTWPDGTKSTSESDCKPFEQTTPEDRERYSWTSEPRTFGAGNSTITVKLLGSTGQTLLKADVAVHVIGGSE